MSEEEGKREALSAEPTTVVMTDFMILKVFVLGVQKINLWLS
jgi:hypothetical protein